MQRRTTRETVDTTARRPLVKDAREQQEARTEQRLQVRQVTHIQASWTEQDRAHAGAFTLQLILDNGAAEYIVRPTAEDIDMLLKLFRRSTSATFDLERKVLMFSDLALG